MICTSQPVGFGRYGGLIDYTLDLHFFTPACFLSGLAKLDQGFWFVYVLSLLIILPSFLWGLFKCGAYYSVLGTRRMPARLSRIMRSVNADFQLGQRGCLTRLSRTSTSVFANFRLPTIPIIHFSKHPCLN